MLDIQKILVVVDGQDDGEIVLAKAITLAKALGADLQLCKIVYEGFVDLSVHEVEESEVLKRYLMEAEESFLEDLIDPVSASEVTIDAMVLWHRHAYEGILDAREAVGADLIMKGVGCPGDEVIRTPQDWNLLRSSPVPVMLIKPEAWAATPNIHAAVDVENEDQAELSRRVMRAANAVCQQLEGSLSLIDAFPSVEHWVGPVTLTIDFDNVRSRVRNAIQSRLESLAGDQNITVANYFIEEGEADVAIAGVQQQHACDLLLVGTEQRDGVRGLVIGNTAEAILHRVNCDVLVIG